jgi:hypothetical protein
VLGARCDTQAPPPPAPLARLTGREYQRTLRDLFPGVPLPSLTALPDGDAGGYDSFAQAQPAGAALVEIAAANAHAVAVAALGRRTGWFPCTGTDELACGKALVAQLGQRAYRRPLDADERGRYEALFADTRTAFGQDAAIRVVVEALLQSPGFLYRAELGTAGALAPYELASRLSYFLWDSMPDEPLFAAAAGGGLGTAPGIEAQARRLLADPRAKEAVAHFQEQWLRLDTIANARKDASVVAGWGGGLALSLQQTAMKFAEHAFWERGSLADLLSSPQAFVDARTAPLYGLTAAGSEPALVDLPATQRAGILTQAGLMTVLGSETGSAPVRRGVFVLERLLCAAPPPPPPDAMSREQKPTGPVVTTRDRFEKQHTGPACTPCHAQIDGLGFAFENYDAVGRWRDTDNGAPVDARGEILDIAPDVDGPITGAVELARKLAGSATVRDCVAATWLSYAVGSGPDQLAACTLQPIVQRFADSKLDLRELLVAIATSDAFRRRPAFTP